MVLIVLILLLGNVLFFRITKPAGKAGKVFALVFGTLIGIAAGMVIALFFSFVLPHQTFRPETDRTQLVALGARSQAEGVFFLASGRIDTGQYYKYYYLLPDGGIKFGQIPAENATVYEL